MSTNRASRGRSLSVTERPMFGTLLWTSGVNASKSSWGFVPLAIIIVNDSYLNQRWLFTPALPHAELSRHSPAASFFHTLMKNKRKTERSGLLALPAAASCTLPVLDLYLPLRLTGHILHLTLSFGLSACTRSHCPAYFRKAKLPLLPTSVAQNYFMRTVLHLERWPSFERFIAAGKALGPVLDAAQCASKTSLPSPANGDVRSACGGCLSAHTYLSTSLFSPNPPTVTGGADSEPREQLRQGAMDQPSSCASGIGNKSAD
ncbi:hypothetical protein B0H13DRAFT_2664314 [Mycena leptocephala]|nr:hypothetical protein B0H13DRAFT_2664314 [Mycena leptocephala]